MNPEQVIDEQALLVVDEEGDVVGTSQEIADRDLAPPRYRVHGVSRPGGHGHIRCNTTDLKVDTGSISDGSRPGLAELLCASLAACLLKNIERYSELLPFEYQVAAIEVEADRQNAPPRMIRLQYRIEIVTDERQPRVDLLHRNIRKFGTITNTLAAACDLTGEMVARRPPEQTGKR
jgi:uncharacterized OsmC-like protein